MKVVVVFLLILGMIESAKILVVNSYSTKSHYLFALPITRELAKRGHEVTALVTYEDEDANYKQIRVETKMFWDYPGIDIVNFGKNHYFKNMKTVWDSVHYMTDFMLNSTSLQDFIKNDKTKFDLILIEMFYQEALMMLSHKYNVPMIGFGTMSYTQHIGYFMGNPILPGIVKHEFMFFNDDMGFFDRIYNAIGIFFELFGRHYYALPMHQKLAEKYFSNLPKPLPKLEDLHNRINTVLINGHFSLDAPKPMIPGIIEVGGVHVKAVKPLRQKLKTFLDGAKDGAILFSLGSNFQIKNMDKKRIDMLVKVFGSLKQRVIFKWEADNYPGRPDNVLMDKWLPQGDILAHPNLKLFITHAGLLSTHEAVYHGIPVIAFPFYGDQFLNAARFVKNGVGLQLSYENLSEDVLKNTINTIINDPGYKQRAIEYSNRFKDRPQTALDTAIYWIEYNLRHKNLSYMESPARKQPFYVNLMLDVLGAFLAITALIIGFIYYVIKLIISRRGSNINLNKKIN